MIAVMKAVQGAAVNQGSGLRFIRPHALEKIHRVGKAPFFSFRDNPFPRGRRHVFYRQKPHPQVPSPTCPADAAFKNIRRQNGQAQAPGLGYIGESGIKPALVADHRGHEFRRVMGFQIGRLKRYPGIGGTVGLAEGIAVKAHDHAPDPVPVRIPDPPGTGAGCKSPEIIRQLTHPVLFGHHLAQAVGFRVGKSGHLHGHPGDILLVDHQAVGFRQNIRHQGMNRRPCTPMEPPDIFLDHLVGGRPDDGRMDHQVLEIADAGLLLQKAHGRAFDVEAAHGPSFCKHLPGGRIRFRSPAVLIEYSAVLPHIGNSIPYHPQAPVAQQINFYQACRLHRVLFPLNNGHAFGSGFHRHISIDTLRGDDHTPGVHGQIPRQPGDPPGDGQYFRPGFGQIAPARPGHGRDACGRPGKGSRGCLRFFPEFGNPPGGPPDLPLGQSKDPRGFPHRHAGLETNMIGHHGGTARIFLQDAGDHRVTLIPGKIHINIRRVLAARV